MIAGERHGHLAGLWGCTPDGVVIIGEALDWATLTDAELEVALRSLVAEGYLPGDDEVLPS